MLGVFSVSAALFTSARSWPVLSVHRNRLMLSIEKTVASPAREPRPLEYSVSGVDSAQVSYLLHLFMTPGAVN